MRVVRMLTILFLLGASTAVYADGVRKEGNVWLPETIGKGEILPVLIVHQDAVDPEMIDLERLVRTHRVAIVHASHGGLLGGRPGGLDTSVRLGLAEATRVLPQIEEAPWILGAFGKRGGLMTGLAYTGLHTVIGLQGKVFAQPVIRVKRVDGNPLPQHKGLRMLLLESEPTDESTAQEIVADVAKAGVQAKAERLERASLREDLTARVGAFLKTFAGQRVKTHALLPPLARKGDYETVQIKGADDLLLTADLYRAKDASAPVLILFHQARSSRGEYRRIASRLVARGYAVLALDQRSGDAWGGIANETAKRAKDKGLANGYIDARPDLDRAVAWARELGLKGKLGIVGSSYSSSLVIFVGADNKDVSAVVSFSPGDYLPPRGSILEVAKRLTKPTLVVCPPREERQATQVFEPIAAKNKKLYVQPEGVHGASTLDRSETFDEAWKVFLDFVDAHLK